MKYGGECIFPAGKAAQTEVAVAPELVAMLQRLEKVVQTLEPKGPEQRQGNSAPSSSRPEGSREHNQHSPPASAPTIEVSATGVDAEAPVPDGTVCFEARGQALGSSKDSSPKAKDGENGGRIIVDAGRDTYVRRWFWETLNAEVSNILPQSIAFLNSHYELTG